MGWKFYAGVTLMLVGLGLMAYPDSKPCVDCDDEVTTESGIIVMPLSGEGREAPWTPTGHEEIPDD